MATVSPTITCCLIAHYYGPFFRRRFTYADEIYAATRQAG
jgi:hypothetical protein